MEFRSFLSALLLVLGLGATAVLSGCGHPARDLKSNPEALKPVSLAAEPMLSERASSNPLAAAVRAAGISHEAREGGTRFVIRADLLLQQGEGTQRYSFASSDGHLSPKESPEVHEFPYSEEGFFGRLIPMALCSDGSCRDLTRGPEAPLRASLRCTDARCDSAVLGVLGVRSPYQGNVAVIERQTIDELESPSVTSANLRSPVFLELQQRLTDPAWVRTGVLSVTQVHGTPILRLSIYAKLVSSQGHEDGRPDSHREAQIGALFLRNHEGAVTQSLTSGMTDLDRHEHQLGWRRGEPRLAWDPASGRLSWSMQEGAGTDAGSLTIDFESPRLVKPALEGLRAEALAPSWIF